MNFNNTANVEHNGTQGEVGVWGDKFVNWAGLAFSSFHFVNVMYDMTIYMHSVLLVEHHPQSAFIKSLMENGEIYSTQEI